MRLHTLTVTAFGPFAARQHIAFDDLADAGLFLLHGPTGAGKTSVLDAVCFALYGAVPGARQSPGASLRSDHAPPGVLTEVSLELTVAGRRLEITRRPAQPRPKARGTGFTTERAQSLLREYDAESGAWKALSRSHQEIGEEIGQLLGMSRDQFCQVVLLPQGDFARFLRADAEARGRLLGRLFDTRRFAAVEDRLAERRRAAEHQVRAGDEKLLALAHRMQQAAGPAADGLPAPRQQPGDPGLAAAVLEWAAVARAGAGERRDIAQSALDAAESRRTAALHALDAAQELARLQQRHADARRRSDALHARRAEREQLQERLDRARRADRVATALRLRDDAEREHREASAAHRRAAAQLPPENADAGAEHLSALERQLRQEAGGLDAARRAETRDAELARELAALDRQARADDELLQEADGWLAGWDTVHDGLRRRIADAQEAATRAEHLAGRLDPARRRRDAARERDRLALRAEEAVELLSRRRDETAAARERWLDLKERRLRGIAAELAGGLTPGDPCAVCGSPDHPAPARTTADHVDRAAEEAAYARYAEADADRTSAERELAVLHESFTAARTQARAPGPGGPAGMVPLPRHSAESAGRPARSPSAPKPPVAPDTAGAGATARAPQPYAAGRSRPDSAGAPPAAVDSAVACTPAAPARGPGGPSGSSCPDTASAADSAAVRANPVATDSDATAGAAGEGTKAQRHPAAVDPAAACTAADARADAPRPGGAGGSSPQDAASAAEPAGVVPGRPGVGDAAVVADRRAFRLTAEDPAAAELERRVADLEREHEEAHRVASGLHAAQEALERAEREHRERLDARQQAERRAAARMSRREALEREQAGLRDELARARGGAGSVAERAALLERGILTLSSAAEAVRAVEDSARRLKEADDRLADAAFQAGFDTPRAAAAALLDDTEQRELQHRVDAWHTEEAAVADRLAEPETRAAAEQPPADPGMARAAHEAAERRLRDAASRLAAARERCAELARLSRQAAAEARGLGPLREEYDRIARLAGLAAGTSAENERKMRLESYVLAARLEQVAAAATVRLQRMSAGRYTLVHSDARTGGKRSGLGLHVVDAWTGRERDTATLSGGETFFASLALALGLADVVTEEAGGVRLDTLFIDEGFGSLDDQTLDEVLDVLDSLRERDRSVGIVSHVPDLRRRIPAQLEVVKGRAGSTARLRTAADALSG
ncbi:AAA family ATPase [Streptomyces sp. PR69]|uniref:AAA family ATPase n=1 Tax=Streptomyces sp. PR69 TaxID=2984950 RepID=UPI002264FEC1|nr:AAA family ATPase [Streptomyces sp. PR69]